MNIANCTGCGACSSICPKSSILLVPSNEGFLYPQINDSTCIKCNACEKVCPAINPRKQNNENTKSYAIINSNEAIRLQSSSGGIFTLLAEQIIKNDGVVFGAKFSSDFSIIHSYSETIEGIADFRGSKYVQSIIGNSYTQCKTFLDAGREVLFSGTPCQISGLKNFLNKDYENLFTVDFICHGVPSPLLWNKYIDYRTTKSGVKRNELEKTAFRRKDFGWKQFSLVFTYVNASEYCATLNKDPYFQLFLKDVALRKSCYDCPCRGIARPSDITLADFWGIRHIIPTMDDNKGVSLVISHSDKGLTLINSIKNNCICEEIKLEQALKFNSSITKSPSWPYGRNIFYDKLNTIPFEQIIQKYAKTSFSKKVFKYIKRIYKKLFD